MPRESTRRRDLAEVPPWVNDRRRRYSAYNRVKRLAKRPLHHRRLSHRSHPIQLIPISGNRYLRERYSGKSFRPACNFALPDGPIDSGLGISRSSRDALPRTFYSLIAIRG